MPPLRAIVAEYGPTPQRLRKLVDALIAVKRRRAADDPELFTAYRTLAVYAKSVVAAHIQEMIGLVAKIIPSGIEEGTFRTVDPVSAGRVVLVATSEFHHPAHAAEWTDNRQQRCSRRSDRPRCVGSTRAKDSRFEVTGARSVAPEDMRRLGSNKVVPICHQKGSSHHYTPICLPLARSGPREYCKFVESVQ